MHENNSQARIKNFLFNVLIFTLLFLPDDSNAQTPCSGGMAGGFPCNNVELLAHISYGTTNANDIWGWKSPTTNEEFAIIGLVNGVSFVNITNPASPVIVGNVANPGGSSSWADIKVNGHYVYVVTEANTHHIRVFDLRQLENVTNGPISFEYASTFGTVGDGSAHNIVLNEELGYAVAVGAQEASGGLIFHDLSNPLSPTKIGEFAADGYSHDAMCFIYRGADVEHMGKEICIGFNEDSYTIVDVTNKSNPIQLSRTPYTGSRYTHQGWITDDQKFLFIDDELDELNNPAVTNTTTYIFDISDLDNPPSTPFHTFVSTANAIDHNLFIKGSYVYQANYRAGLRILDISNLETGVGSNKVTEAAYFDVYPADNNTGFQGAWGVYPYLKSGNVLVSSIGGGLFVVRPNLEHFIVDLTSESVKTTNQNGSVTYALDITGYSGFNGLVNLEVTNLPATMTAIFSQDNFSPNGTSLLTITDNGTSPGGNYSLIIEGTTTEANIPKQRLRVGMILNSSVLPVSWTAFSAKAQETSIDLEWLTANEFNNQGFAIERSLDAKKDFTKIGWVAGKGTTSESSLYRFRDTDVESGETYYYRLRQIDADHQFSFSKVITAQIKNVATKVKLTPNPARETVNIKVFNAKSAAPTRLDMLTLDGKVVWQLQDFFDNTSFDLPLHHLSPGIYILRLQLPYEVVTERLVVH